MTHATDNPAEQTEGHRLFVRLPVKPDQFDAYVDAMRLEAEGARGEAGNLGFDIFRDSNQPHTIYLLEHWASEHWLLQEHAKQPYYVRVRGMESESLEGNVEERLLSEISPDANASTQTTKTIGGHYARAHVMTLSEAPANELVTVFNDAANVFREADGNYAWILFHNRRDSAEYVLIESWATDVQCEKAWSHTNAANFAQAYNRAVSGNAPIVMTNFMTE